MSQPNEFSGYKLEVLEKKKKHFKRLQIMTLVFAGLSTLIISVAALIKNDMKAFQLVPFLVVLGVVYPILILGPIRKKIQLEIDSRGQA